jgi:hypothetical protein
MLTELIKGRHLAECKHLTANDLSTALDGIPTGKGYCADVAIAALQNGINTSRQPSSKCIGVT